MQHGLYVQLQVHLKNTGSTADDRGKDIPDALPAGQPTETENQRKKRKKQYTEKCNQVSEVDKTNDDDDDDVDDADDYVPSSPPATTSNTAHGCSPDCSEAFSVTHVTSSLATIVGGTLQYTRRAYNNVIIRCLLAGGGEEQGSQLPPPYILACQNIFSLPEIFLQKHINLWSKNPHFRGIPKKEIKF